MSSMEREDPALESFLKAAAEEERATLDAARSLQDAPGIELVAGVVRRSFEEQRRRARRRVLLLSAAALVLALGLTARFLLFNRPGQSSTLGDEPVVLLAPVGASAAFSTFTWESTSAAAWFEVVVEDGSAAGVSVTRSGRLSSHTWSSDPQEVSSWPDRIRWEVRAFDASGALLGAASASAWRSP